MRKVRSQTKNFHSFMHYFLGSRSDPLGECRIKKGSSLGKKNIKRSFHSTIPRLCLTYGICFLLSQLRLKNVC